jgi:hypothetical protein
VHHAGPFRLPIAASHYRRARGRMILSQNCVRKWKRQLEIGIHHRKVS